MLTLQRRGYQAGGRGSSDGRTASRHKISPEGSEVYDLPECPPVMLDEAPEGGLGVWILVDSDDKTCTYEYGGGIA
jgi:hypothetical protein